MKRSPARTCVNTPRVVCMFGMRYAVGASTYDILWLYPRHAKLCTTKFILCLYVHVTWSHSALSIYLYIYIYVCLHVRQYVINNKKVWLYLFRADPPPLVSLYSTCTAHIDTWCIRLDGSTQTPYTLDEGSASRRPLLPAGHRSDRSSDA